MGLVSYELLGTNEVRIAQDQFGRSSCSSTSNRVRRSGIQREPRRFVDHGEAQRVEQVSEGPPAVVQERVRDLDRPRGPDDARQRPEPIAVLQRHGVDLGLARHLEHLEQDAGLEVGHVTTGDQGELGPDGRQPRVDPGEGALAFGRVAREPCRGADRHRRFGRVGRQDDDHLRTHLAQTQHGVLQHAHPAVRLGELVAAEPRGAPARQDDARDLRQAGPPSTVGRRDRGRRPAPARGSGRTGTRSVP